MLVAFAQVAVFKACQHVNSNLQAAEIWSAVKLKILFFVPSKDINFCNFFFISNNCFISTLQLKNKSSCPCSYNQVSSLCLSLSRAEYSCTKQDSSATSRAQIERQLPWHVFCWRSIFSKYVNLVCLSIFPEMDFPFLNRNKLQFYIFFYSSFFQFLVICPVPRRVFCFFPP